MRSINDAGLNLVKSFEGLKLCVYKDINGFDTIGYGHKITPNDNIPCVITEDEAVALLCNDLEIAEDAVCELVTVDLNDNQFAALVDFTYNLGAGRLKASTLLKLLNNGDYDNAALEFVKWDKANGVQSDGLLRRRQAETDLFNDPNCIPPNPNRP